LISLLTGTLVAWRKPTYMDITIHFSSNHPYDHKLAAFKYYIHRTIIMPITEKAVKQEWNKIIKMARNNGFPKQIVHKLRNKLITKRDRPSQTQLVQQHNKKWITFTYYGPAVQKSQIYSNALTWRWPSVLPTRFTSNCHKSLTIPTPAESTSLNATRAKMPTWDSRVGQIITRYKEHLRYIRYNNPISAYAMHILNNRHDFGSTEETLLKPCTKGTRMNCWDALFIHLHHRHHIPISEQEVTDTNPPFDLAYVPRDLQHLP
jgi:hypothetical protein